MKFKFWFEQNEKDFDFYKNIIVKLLGIDEEKGLSQEINTYNSNELLTKIESLGEFKQLPAEIQQNVSNRIRSEEGTLFDLVKDMVGQKI